MADTHAKHDAAVAELAKREEMRIDTLKGTLWEAAVPFFGINISPEELENDFQIDPGVNEVLVYEKDSKIIAEIFPEEEFMGNQEYFDALMAKVNEGRPAYKQIAAVKLREEEFIKNTSKKIIRYKNIPQ